MFSSIDQTFTFLFSLDSSLNAVSVIASRSHIALVKQNPQWPVPRYTALSQPLKDPAFVCLARHKITDVTSLVCNIFKSVSFLSPRRYWILIGYRGDRVKKAVKFYPLPWLRQITNRLSLWKRYWIIWRQLFFMPELSWMKVGQRNKPAVLDRFIMHLTFGVFVGFFWRWFMLYGDQYNRRGKVLPVSPRCHSMNTTPFRREGQVVMISNDSTMIKHRLFSDFPCDDL